MTSPILGGPAQFTEPLHVGRPNIGDREVLLRRIGEILDRRWLTNGGPLVHELEEIVAESHGVAGAVAVCNATLGLQLLARGLGLAGEILMPAFTFVATAHAVMWQGAQPEFVDIRRSDHNIDVDAVEAAITERTGGIVGVHLWGRPCAVDGAVGSWPPPTASRSSSTPPTHSACGDPTAPSVAAAERRCSASTPPSS